MIYNIIILDKCNKLIKVFFTILESFLKVFIYYFLCKSIFIFYNNINLYYIKLQTLFINKFYLNSIYLADLDLILSILIYFKVFLIYF